MALEVLVRLDVGLHEELVHAAVAAGDDDDVLLRALDHRHGVVDRGLRDLELALREPVALLLRIHGEEDLDLEAVALENALRRRGDHRQRLRAGEHLHLDRGLREGRDRKQK